MAKVNGTAPQKPRTAERRQGLDRRRNEGKPPLGWERRRSVEPRKPEVAELDLTESQWGALQGEPLPAKAGPTRGRLDP
ncbi:MAG TPA: hypothetical protein VIW70_17435 [Rubrivivax sp.]